MPLVITQSNQRSDYEQQAADLHRQQFAKIAAKAEQIRAERTTNTEAPMPNIKPDLDNVRTAAEEDDSYLAAISAIVSGILKDRAKVIVPGRSSPDEDEEDEEDKPQGMAALSDAIWKQRRGAA